MQLRFALTSALGLLLACGSTDHDSTGDESSASSGDGGSSGNYSAADSGHTGTEVASDAGHASASNDAAQSGGGGSHADASSAGGGSNPGVPTERDAGRQDAGKPRDAGTPTTPPSSGDGGVDVAAMQQRCVDTINMYRAMLSLPPYARAADKESCVDGEAAADGASGTAHGAFGTCKESAQDECPGWPSKDIPGQTDKCLAQMWAEGPGDFNMGHGHYINMSSTKYKSVACGYHDLGNGKFWATQDFF